MVLPLNQFGTNAWPCYHLGDLVDGSIHYRMDSWKVHQSWFGASKEVGLSSYIQLLWRLKRVSTWGSTWIHRPTYLRHLVSSPLFFHYSFLFPLFYTSAFTIVTSLKELDLSLLGRELHKPFLVVLNCDLTTRSNHKKI